MEESRGSTKGREKGLDAQQGKIEEDKGTERIKKEQGQVYWESCETMHPGLYLNTGSACSLIFAFSKISFQSGTNFLTSTHPSNDITIISEYSVEI